MRECVVSEDVQVDNLESMLKDPMNADFSQFDGAQASETGVASVSAADAVLPDSDKDDTAKAGTGDSSAASATESKEPKPAGIQTRDGKHIIPFDVLQAERDRASRAEAQLAELNAKLAQAQDAAAKGVVDPSASVEDIIPADELETLKAEMPVLGATFERLINEIKSLRTTAQQTSNKVVQDEQVETARRVQAAIDANPKLVYVQSKSPETFDAICKVDDWVRTQPWAQSLSLEDRFARSIAMYESAQGVIAVPDSATGSTGTPPADAAAKAQSAIDKALAAAGPNTLTDLPGGNPPPANDIEQATNMSAAALTQHFMTMDQAGVEKFLAKFG